MGPATVPLAHLLETGRAPGAVVAWRGAPGGRDRAIPWEEFRAGVSGVVRALAPLPDGRVALYTADSLAFAVGLFGIWHAGRVAVCPPNAQPDALAALSDRGIASVSDTGTPVAGRPLVSPERRAANAGPLAPLAPDAPAIELYTSGTTGRGKPVAKALFHLDGEVEALAFALGPCAGDAPVFGSASHQHLYGMAFRVLWPLAAGRPFHASALLHAEELAMRLRGREGCALVSVPAHLKRLAERDGFEDLARRFRAVFSSGGPLSPETAERWEAAHGEAPIEVFGSTETGGVAWRRQGRGHAGAPWTPFAGVRVSLDPSDGRLRVHSPIASVGDLRSGFAMGDRARVHADGRFSLEGRADRVLKIGEKRLSLPDMEERLHEHAFVAAAALLPLERSGETRVAAAVVLSGRGRAALRERGRRAVSLELREALSREWDRVLLPRSFRFVAELPEDAQGKRPVRLLRALFDAGAAPSGDAP